MARRRRRPLRGTLAPGGQSHPAGGYTGGGLAGGAPTSAYFASGTAAQAPPLNPFSAVNAGQALHERDNSLAELGQEEADVRQTFGFDDPSNPFSRAALLRRSYGQQQNRTTNSYAAAGQLYSGAIGNQRATDTFSHDRSTDETRREYDRLLQSLIARRRRVNTGYADAQGQNAAQDLQYGIDYSS